MRNFVEYVDADTGRNVAIPAKYVCAVSGVDGGVSKITSYLQDTDGTLTFPGVKEAKENQVMSTTPYDEIMAQLR